MDTTAFGAEARLLYFMITPKTVREVTTLNPDILREYPIWEYVDGPDERVLVSAVALPALHFKGRLVGTVVDLKSGKKVWALLLNIRPSDDQRKNPFLEISLWTGSEWFSIPLRIDDGSPEVAKSIVEAKMGLGRDTVFPISFCLPNSLIKAGDCPAVSGTIDIERNGQHNIDELVRMALQVSDEMLRVK